LHTAFYKIKFSLDLSRNGYEVAFLKSLCFQVLGQQIVVSRAYVVKKVEVFVSFHKITANGSGIAEGGEF